MEHEPALAPVVASAPARLEPGITVCMAVHPVRLRNGLAMRALQSVCAQTLQPARILILNDTAREGVGVIRQRLLEQVSTEWTAWIDSDDEWYPEHLEKLMKVAEAEGSVYVFSWFAAAHDPLGHFGRPFSPCRPHHTTMGILEKTEIAQEVGFPPSATEGRFSNEDWAHITRFAKLACERDLIMSHLVERTWVYHMGHGNTSGLPGQGDAR